MTLPTEHLNPMQNEFILFLIYFFKEPSIRLSFIGFKGLVGKVMSKRPMLTMEANIRVSQAILPKYYHPKVNSYLLKSSTAFVPN